MRSWENAEVAIVGLGSGGFPVMQHLAMSGVRRFSLIDPDTLERSNLVKHMAGSTKMGTSKVSIAQEWLSDRAFDVHSEAFQVDVFDMLESDLERVLASADLLVSATDNEPSREFINDLAIRHEIPMAVGLVHRQGLGGTVALTEPGQTGCYICMRMLSESLGGLPSEADLAMDQEEAEAIYGLRGIAEFDYSGLSCDISMIASLHSQAIIAYLQNKLCEDPRLPHPPNWIAMGIRTLDGGAWRWDTLQLELPRLKDCPGCRL